MSKYPGNRYWNQEEDIPETLYTRKDWDDAEAGGYITPEHVMERAGRMIAHALGIEDGGAYDEEGFFVSLVSAGHSNGTVTLKVWSNDHEPPHAHVDYTGVKHGKLTINLDTGEFIGDPEGLNRKQQKKVESFFQEKRDVLVADWNKRNQEGPTDRAR